MHVCVFFINIGFYHQARLCSTLLECRRRGWRLTVVQLTNDTLEHPWGDASEGAEFEILTLLPKGTAAKRRHGLPLLEYRRVAQVLGRIQPDLVLVPGWSFQMCRQVVRWTRSNGIPAVVMSESKRDDGPRSWWREQLKSCFIRRNFQAAIVGGDMHARYLAELGMPPRLIFKGYDAVDNAHFARAADMARKDPDAVRARTPALPARPFLMGAFRLLPRKNALRLVEAYAAYREEMRELSWDLVICGTGEQFDELASLISARGLAGFVHLVGFLPYDEVAAWYGMAECFVHPALQEQWGLVVNEACAAGLPVLCSNGVGSAPDLVHHGVNGYLFDPGSVQAISAAMVKLHRDGPEARRRMGEASRRLVAQLAPEVFGRSVASAVEALTRCEG